MLKNMEVNRRCLILAQVVVGGDRSDFHIVDLEAGKVLKTGIQSSLNRDGEGDVVMLGTSIYNIGGLRPIDLPEIVPALENGGDHHIHLGASCLELTIPPRFDDDDDLNLGSNKWKDISHTIDRCIFSSCASLGGKVYAFDSLSAETCGEMFDPLIGQWKLLLPPSDISLDSLFVSPRVLSDEKNNRLLVHFYDLKSLYAYYPAGDMGRWMCLVSDFRMWVPAATLADDVLIFHIPEIFDCLVAFDLSTKTWLKVNYSSNFPRVEISFSEWEDMLYLGNDMLCLANYCPFGHPVHTYLQFVKLRLERISSHDLLVTFVSSQSFPFIGRLSANRFILL